LRGLKNLERIPNIQARPKPILGANGKAVKTVVAPIKGTIPETICEKISKNSIFISSQIFKKFSKLIKYLIHALYKMKVFKKHLIVSE
jgi:hypothetical protein